MARFQGTIEGGGEGGYATRSSNRFLTTDTDGQNCGVTVDGGAFGGDNNRFNVYATGGSEESRESHRIAEVADIDGERVITLFKLGKIVAQFTA